MWRKVVAKNQVPAVALINGAVLSGGFDVGQARSRNVDRGLKETVDHAHDFGEVSRVVELDYRALVSSFADYGCGACDEDCGFGSLVGQGWCGLFWGDGWWLRRCS